MTTKGWQSSRAIQHYTVGGRKRPGSTSKPDAREKEMKTFRTGGSGGRKSLPQNNRCLFFPSQHCRTAAMINGVVEAPMKITTQVLDSPKAPFWKKPSIKRRINGWPIRSENCCSDRAMVGVYHKQPYSSQGRPTARPDVRNRALRVEMDKEAQQWERQCQPWHGSTTLFNEGANMHVFNYKN